MRHSSGFSVSARREFQGWNSTVDIWTAQVTLAISVTHCFFLLMRRPPRSTRVRSSAASDVYKRQPHGEDGSRTRSCCSHDAAAEHLTRSAATLSLTLLAEGVLVMDPTGLSLIH